MSNMLRIILLISSVLSFIYIIRKLIKSQLLILDALYWLIVSVVLLVCGVFPAIPINIAHYIGIESPVNFVFLFMIFIVMLRCFLLTMRLSKLEGRFRKLVEELSVRKKLEEEHRENTIS